MRSIQNGWIYDTEKAEVIAKHDSPRPSHEDEWFEELLYRTEKDNWFIYGNGNRNTQYNHMERIRPVDRHSALAWIQDMQIDLDDNEKILEYFADELDEA